MGIHAWQENLYRRTPTWSTDDIEAAAQLLDDAIDHGQAQPRTLADLFGGKKRLEKMRPNRFIHAFARV